MTASSEPSLAPVAGRAATGRTSAPAVRASLLRYRVIAYVVGVGLIALVAVGVPVKYIGGDDTIVAAIGPIHGVLYMVYLACTLDLASRCRFSVVRSVLIMLAGTIPFLSFVAERRVTALVRIGLPAAAPTATQIPAAQTPATQTPATQTPATQTPATETPTTRAPTT